MNSYTGRHGFSFSALRGTLHLPPRHVQWSAPAAASSEAHPGWLERLAMWSERQPEHHRMGSYTRRR